MSYEISNTRLGNPLFLLFAILSDLISLGKRSSFRIPIQLETERYYVTKPSTMMTPPGLGFLSGVIKFFLSMMFAIMSFLAMMLRHLIRRLWFRLGMS